jgi:glutamate-1-semialdehyde 2,1-aminomutase
MSSVTTSRIAELYSARFPKSAELYRRGQGLFPSGVTHDARYLTPFPVYANTATGSKKHSVDGHDIIDYWMGHGAMLLGHSHPAIVQAVQQQVALSTHPGACHELELEWGQLVQDLVPSAEHVRFTNSGTEATLMAVRVARIVSGKTKVIKFAGHFHGWHDGLMTASDPPHGGEYVTPGITDGIVDDIVIVPPNDIEALARAIDEHDPACVFHEGNGTHWGIVPARAPFMNELRQLTKDKGVIFILDEVITGFRVHPNSFQGHCGIVPDMTTMAKVLAGGLPGGCLAGRADLLDAIAFDNSIGRKMKHPGTYNGNPLSAAAGIEALKIVATGEPAEKANGSAADLRLRLNQLFQSKGAKWAAYGDFSAIKIHANFDGEHSDAADFLPFDGDWRKLDEPFGRDLTHAFRCALLLGGVDWMGWGGSTSTEHSAYDIEQTVAAFEQTIDLLRADGFDV